MNFFSRLTHRVLLPSLCLSAASFVGVGTAHAQISTLRTGKLPNGLAYYISKDAGGSQGTAHFYLLQNVGALLENDKQQGLAHFLEHMAFNSTKHYPQGVMTWLRQRGLYDYDARTGQDETRFSISEVPTAAPGLTDSVMMVLRDWCDGVNITDKDTEKERGIVIEEWRQRNTVSKRLSDSIAAVVYNNSQYAARNVIGPLKSLETLTAKDVQRFYRTWYRPDLQCVVIVGDIDPEVYEAKIKEMFGSIKKAKKAEVRADFAIADNSTPLYYRFVDAENQSHSYGLYQRVATPTSLQGQAATKEFLFQQLFNDIAPKYFAYLRNDNREDFIAASVSYSPLVRGYGQFAWDVVPYRGKDVTAMQQVLNERSRLLQPIPEQLFDNAKQSLYDGMKQALEDDKNLGTPDNFFDQYRRNFLYGTPLKELRAQLQDNLETLVELEAEDLQAWLQEKMGHTRNLAFVAYTASEKEPAITQDEAEKLLASTKADDGEAPQQASAPKNLIDFALPQGKIVREQRLPSLEAVEWTLSNGMKVVYKSLPNDLKGEVMLLASANGGQMLVKTEDLASFAAMQGLIMQSGVYKYSRNQLASWLGNRPIEVDLTINDYLDGFQARSKTDEADALFSYLYLVLARQNFSQPVFDKWLQRKEYVWASRPQVGKEAVDRQVQEVLSPITPDNPREDKAFFSKMRFNDLERLYKEHFGNAAHFNACLVGDLSEAEAKRLVTTYLAALPGDAKQPRKAFTPADYAARDFTSKERIIDRQFEVDTPGDMGEVELSFILDQPHLSERQVLALALIEPLLQNVLFDELREREQATYSIAVSENHVVSPVERATLSIRFSTSREKADHLKARTLEILRAMAAGNIDNDAFKKVQIPFILDEEERDKQQTSQLGLGVWLALLNNYVETGKVPELPVANASSKTTSVSGNGKGTSVKKSADAKEATSNKGNTAAPAEQSVRVSDVKAADLSAVLQRLLNDARQRFIIVKSQAPENKKWEHN